MTVDEAFLASIAAEKVLPIGDLRRVAYPQAAGWRWASRRFVASDPPDSPISRRLSAALDDLRDLNGNRRPRDAAVVFVAQMIDVAEETLGRWAAGASHPTCTQVHAVGEALGLPSWQLWLL